MYSHMNRTLTLLLTVVALAAALAWAMIEARAARGEARRCEASLRSAVSLTRRYYTRDSLGAVCRAAQYRTIAELRSERADLTAELENMRVRLRRAESVTRIATETEYCVVLDTVFVPVRDTARPALRYADKWLTAQLVGDSLSIRTTDSLTVVMHSRRRRFLFWTWRKYSGEVSVVSHNPHNTISGVETVCIEK